MRLPIYLLQTCVLVCALMSLIQVNAHEPVKKRIRADSHAPIGMMADHMHKKGEYMLSYRHMYMDMSGNEYNGRNISDDTIVTTIANRFYGASGQPANIRVVPEKMEMQMHMIGAMYAPSDWLTLMVMASYQEKEMTLTTYKGMMGTEVRGKFTTKSDGWGDTKVSGLVKLYTSSHHKLHAHLGTSLPTGSTNETDSILNPMGMTPTVRLPYGMQLGAGTYALLHGLTYVGAREKVKWGTQYSATNYLGDDNGYTRGDKYDLTGWVSYQPINALSGSLRIKYSDQGSISGIDSNIMLPTQAADPRNYGGETTTLLVGLNWAAQPNSPARGLRIGIEAGLPISQNLHGLQMDTDFSITSGLQYMF